MSKIIVTGNPVDGFTYHGPFDELTDVIADDFEGDWWVADLQPLVPVAVEWTHTHKLTGQHARVTRIVNGITVFDSEDEPDMPDEELLSEIFDAQYERIQYVTTPEDDAYRLGYEEGLGDMGMTYDDDSMSPRSQAYDRGRTQRRVDEGWETAP